MEFTAEGLQGLGALCERTWHDRLQVVADGPAAAAALGRPGELVETELRFPEGTALDPVRDVFPGCPLCFAWPRSCGSKCRAFSRAALPVHLREATTRGCPVARLRTEQLTNHASLPQTVKPAWHFT